MYDPEWIGLVLKEEVSSKTFATIIPDSIQDTAKLLELICEDILQGKKTHVALINILSLGQ